MTAESEYEEAEEDALASRFPQDQYRELIVIDPAIVAGPLASSDDASAPFSFRSQMQWLAGATREPLEFTRGWLRAWENTSEVGPEFAPVTPRPAVRSVLVNAWLSASNPAPSAVTTVSAAPGDGTGYAANADPASGYAEPEPEASSYPEPEPEPEASGYPEPEPEASGYPEPEPTSEPLPAWAHAPFRLIAIVNRVDLASSACEGFAGELRYVYAAVDPETSQPLDLTLIVEVPYPNTRPAAEWARAWRDLAGLPPGEPFAAGLAELALEIQAEGDPLRARLRTNEIAFSDPAEPIWEMRQFDLVIQGGSLELAQVPLEFTPRADLDAAELSDYVLEHATEIESRGISLPEHMRAGAAQIESPDFSWPVLGVSERLRRAFSLQTCNGCHGGDTAALPFRHIGPSSRLDAPARLSRFLYDPDASTDELRRRSGVLSTLTAAECAPASADAAYTGG